MKAPLLIANPTSALGETERLLATLHARLQDALGDVELARTRGPRDAGRLAREAVTRGVRHLIVAGGDGTTSEVVDGLLTAGVGAEVEITPLPLGTGRDFARMFAGPRGWQHIVNALARSPRVPIDAVRVQARGDDGQPVVRHGLNVVSWGVSALAVRRIQRRAQSGRRGKGSYLTSGLVSLARYVPVRVRAEVDGRPVFDAPLVLGVAANGQYFGGGMRVSPGARPDDGWLDVLLVKHAPKWALLLQFPGMIGGWHRAAPWLTKLRARRVTLRSDEPLYVEVDGEPVGSLPATVEVLPGALTLRGPTLRAAP